MSINKIVSRGKLTVCLAMHCLGLAACGNDAIPLPESVAVGIEATQTVTIADATLALLGDYEGEFRELQMEGMSMEDVDGGMQIITTNTSQKAALIGILSRQADAVKTGMEEKNENVTVNFDADYGYVDIYCDKDFYGMSDPWINELVGIIGCIQCVSENLEGWAVTVTINDTQTGNVKVKTGLYEGVEFHSSDIMWNVT